MTSKQASNRLIMIRPARFGFNQQTAITNAFQNEQYADLLATIRVEQQALLEFDRMVEQLRQNHVHVDVFDDTSEPIKPDAIFPNNWFSTHDDGILVLYPMLAENRRLERRQDLIDQFINRYHITGIIDLSVNEQRHQYLEGTGSLVLDRVNRIMYAVRSPRTNPTMAERFRQLMNYRQSSMIFDSIDDNNLAIYHTNVMMSIGTRIAIVCLESVNDQQQRDLIIHNLEHNGQRTLVIITWQQMKQFAGNTLEVENQHGESILLMSRSAYDSLNDQQRHTIERAQTKILYFDIPTIERCGGGSVRCMIAENFLPLSTNSIC
jgi:hypothetical protein